VKSTPVAIAGVVAAVVLGSTTGCSGDLTGSKSAAGPPPTSLPTEDGRSPAAYFKVGDCLQDPPQTGKNATVVDCGKPHSAEVYAVFMLPTGSFPGEPTVKEFADKCPAVAHAYVTPEEGLDPSMHTIKKLPDEGSWSLGDRSVTCFIAFDAPRTGAFGAGRWIK
jgi:hypothetical protein